MNAEQNAREAMELAGRVVLANAGGGPEAAASVIAAKLAEKDAAHEATKAELQALREELTLIKGPTAAQVETFQQACERGYTTPNDPPNWLKMLAEAEAFLTRKDA